MSRATKPQHPLEWYRDPDGRGVDARLHLLDRQMIDIDGVPVSTVDDIELTGVEVGRPIDHDEPPRVSALLVGGVVLTRIFGGRMPRSRWDRIGWEDVTRLATVVELRVHAEDLDATWLERWFRDRVIARIPEDDMRLSELLDLPVKAKDGSRVGVVVDVRLRRTARHGGREGDLELMALLVSPHSRHSTYGYERGRVHGPQPIAAVIRWLHRDSRIIPWECVARVDQDAVVLGVDPPMIPLDTRLPIPDGPED